MKGDKVSIIIPAYNEEKCIGDTLKALRKQNYSPMEVIVVVNGSNDNTFEIAKKNADKVLNFEEAIGVSAARNEGAKIAQGEVLIFLDADSKFSKEAVSKIAEETSSTILGSCLGKGAERSLKSRIFFFFKNWIHRLRIYKGVIDGMLFCHRNIFEKVGGFNEEKKIAEFEDFISKACQKGGKYKLLANCYTITSMRRYESRGYFRTFLFWIRWKVVAIFKKDKEITESYFKVKNKR